jgi:hypothetical protein
MVKIANYAKAAFGAGLGIAGNLAIGLAFLIPGFILVIREDSKPKSSRNLGLLILGFILMFMGVIFGLGLGAGALLGGLADQFNQ